MKEAGRERPRWLAEAIAVWGYVQRNYFLTKRYFMWEVVWLVYITANALAITYILSLIHISEPTRPY